MALPVAISGISTAVAPVGPFKSSGGAYYFFGRDGTTATTLQSYKALNAAAVIAPGGAGNQNLGDITGQSSIGQTWTHDGSTVTSVRVHIWKVGAPTDTVNAEIYATSAGLPVGTALFTSTNTVSGASLGTVSGGQPVSVFSFSGVTTLAASTMYALVINRSSAVDASNYYRWGGDAADTYAGGTTLRKGTSIPNWSVSSGTDRDVTIISASSDTAPETAWSSIATKTGFTTAILNLAAYQVGNVIHMLVQDGTGPATLVATKYLSFNMSTDTFLATTETVSAASILTGTAASGWGCSLVVRSNGNVVCFYNGVQTKVSTNWSRVYYRVRTGVATFAAAEAMVDAGLGVNNTAPIAVLGSSDRTHLLFFNGTNTLQRHLTSANVLGTVASTGATAAALDVCTFGATSHIGFTPAQTFRWTSADNPTVTAASVTFGTPTRTVNDGADVHALYQNSADSDLYVKKSTDSGATFGTGTNVFTATVTAADANVSKNQTAYQRGSSIVFPYIVNDNATLKYNEAVIRSTAVAATAPPVFQSPRKVFAFSGRAR